MNLTELFKPFAKTALILIAISFLFASCSKHNCPAYGNKSKKSYKKYRADIEVLVSLENKA